MPPQVTKAFTSQAAVGAAEGAQDALHTPRSLALHSPDFLNCVLCPYPSSKTVISCSWKLKQHVPSKDKRIWVPNKQLRICYTQHGSLCVLILLRVLH